MQVHTNTTQLAAGNITGRKIWGIQHRFLVTLCCKISGPRSIKHKIILTIGILTLRQ